MGIWKKIFGKKPDKSPYLPIPEEPLDISFAKNFTSNGGLFYITSQEKKYYTISTKYVKKINGSLKK